MRMVENKGVVVNRGDSIRATILRQGFNIALRV